MTPLKAIHRQLTILAMVLLFMLGGATGFVVNQWINGLTSDDLIPGRVQACNTALKSSATALNLIAAGTYTAEESEAIRTLSPSCLEPDVYEQLDPVLLDLVARSPIQ